MYIKKVTFDRVFDVASFSGDFSFMSQGRTEYGVRLRKGVLPREGSTFAIAFVDPGNWSSVLGWRDLTSKEVSLARPTLLMLLQMIDFVWFGPIFIVPLTFLAGIQGFFLATAAVLFAASCWLLRGVRDNRKVRQDLLLVDLDRD